MRSLVFGCARVQIISEREKYLFHICKIACCFFGCGNGETPDKIGGFRGLHLFCSPLMAGIAGFEPANAGVKVLCLDRLGYIPIKKAKQPVFDARSFAYPQAAVRAVFPRYYISIFISCQVKRKPAEAFCFEKKFNAAPSHGA